MRYGRTLGFHEPFFYKLVAVLADTMGHVFPEIRAKQDHIEQVIQREEEAFNKTLDRGVSQFNIDCVNAVWDGLPKGSQNDDEEWEKALRFVAAPDSDEWDAVVRRARRMKPTWTPDDAPFPAKVAFKLYDTYGFPLDLTELMARERGLTVDVAGFNKLMDEQKARARAAQKKQVIELSQVETTTPTHFVGFDKLESPAKVLEVVGVKDKTAVILDASPLYAEMGGQVGDTGEMSGGGELWTIANTQKAGDAWLHFLADKDAPAAGTAGPAFSGPASPRGHPAPSHGHALAALGAARGRQPGRDAEGLLRRAGEADVRFQQRAADAAAGGRCRAPGQRAHPRKRRRVTWTEVSYGDIKGRKDIMQFFGEKYGDVVRVVQIGGKAAALDGYSMELCGGTHTRATGEIGLFRIVGESAIAAGIRRIEAVSGLEAYKRANEELQLIKTVAGKVNSPVGELEKKIESLLAQQKELEKQLKAMQQKQAAEIARSLAAKAQTIGSTPAIVENLGAADGDFLQSIADALKGQFKGVVVLGGTANSAVALVATVSPELHEAGSGRQDHSGHRAHRRRQGRGTP